MGPYVNLLFGAARAHRATFTFWSVTGEIVWVSIYVGLGYAFSGYIAQIAEVAGNIVGLLAALVLAVVLARIIWSRHGPHPS